MQAVEVVNQSSSSNDSDAGPSQMDPRQHSEIRTQRPYPPPPSQLPPTSSFRPFTPTVYTDGSDIPLSGDFVAIHANGEFSSDITQESVAKCRVFLKESPDIVAVTFQITNHSTQYSSVLKSCAKLLRGVSSRTRSQVYIGDQQPWTKTNLIFSSCIYYMLLSRR